MGHAAYNIANLLGAALTASALGLAPEAMRTVFARFGRERSDNPGRLARWDIAGVRVVLDYAHNPEGLHGLLAAATAEPHARLALVLGQAGNRADTEIRELAATAASFRPGLVVLKDIAGMERGRAPGEVAALLREELLRRGLSSEALAFESREADAALCALAWARPGDVVVLPIHGRQARAEVEALLDRAECCAACGRWRKSVHAGLVDEALLSTSSGQSEIQAQGERWHGERCACGANAPDIST